MVALQLVIGDGDDELALVEGLQEGSGASVSDDQVRTVVDAGDVGS